MQTNRGRPRPSCAGSGTPQRWHCWIIAWSPVSLPGLATGPRFTGRPAGRPWLTYPSIRPPVRVDSTRQAARFFKLAGSCHQRRTRVEQRGCDTPSITRAATLVSTEGVEFRPRRRNGQRGVVPRFLVLRRNVLERQPSSWTESAQCFARHDILLAYHTFCGPSADVWHHTQCPGLPPGCGLRPPWGAAGSPSASSGAPCQIK